MAPYYQEVFGNPSSLHLFGREAKDALEKAREQVALLIGADKTREIIFTSGGTEANNLAIRGIVSGTKKKGRHIITSDIEHISVLNPCKSLEKEGYQVTYLPVDHYGMVEPDRLREAITSETILISIMYANNEIGTIQPIREIGAIARSYNIPFHVDGVAAVGQIPVRVREENIDLLSISSNDMYGPKGVGALYIREGIRIVPVSFGGGQERGLRSGTENLPGIVGMGIAAELVREELPQEAQRLVSLRNRLIEGVTGRIKESYLNGHPTQRLPNNVNLRISYIEGESLILSLDMMGIAAATGSACTSKTLEPSRTLLSIGLSEVEAHGSLVFTLGKNTMVEDIDYVLEVLPQIVDRLRSMSPLTPKEYPFNLNP
jgi:cysteine desulfurase